MRINPKLEKCPSCGEEGEMIEVPEDTAMCYRCVMELDANTDSPVGLCPCEKVATLVFNDQDVCEGCYRELKDDE